MCIKEWDKKKDPTCPNGVREDWETCDNCPEDVKDLCIKEWDKKKDPTCPNGIQEDRETCDNCPEDVKDLCINENPDLDIPIIPEKLCWNGEIDEWETCDTCPEDYWGCAKGGECNSCPCEYVDFAANLTRWDTIRAKLWDLPHMVFYNYSNSLAVENYLKIK